MGTEGQLPEGGSADAPPPGDMAGPLLLYEGRIGQGEDGGGEERGAGQGTLLCFYPFLFIWQLYLLLSQASAEHSSILCYPSLPTAWRMPPC